MTSLSDMLGYTVRSPSGMQQSIQRVASSRTGAWTLRRTLHSMDRWVFGLTDGRTTFASMLAGVPIIMLTTKGARTGEARTTPLIGFSSGDGLAVIGSNYGQPATPGWVYNLEAEPSARVAHRDASAAVVARRAGAGETEQVFAAAGTVYVGYGLYRDRARHRDIRVFVLELP